MLTAADTSEASPVMKTLLLLFAITSSPAPGGWGGVKSVGVLVI